MARAIHPAHGPVISTSPSSSTPVIASSSSSSTPGAGASPSSSTIEISTTGIGESASTPLNPRKRKATDEADAQDSSRTPPPLIHSVTVFAKKNAQILTLGRQIRDQEAHAQKIEETLLRREEEVVLRTKERDDAVLLAAGAHASTDEANIRITELENVRDGLEDDKGRLRLDLVAARADADTLHQSVQANGTALQLMREAGRRHQMASEELRVLVATLTASLSRRR